MDWYTVRFRDRESWGEQVDTFRFDKPEGYEFKPGQYFMLALQTVDGEQTKPFSHAAAPIDDFVEMTTRVSDSAFKRALSALTPGQEVEISPAMGRLVLPPAPGHTVFLAGGIGITPLRSIVRDAVQRASGLSAVLIYGNRSPGCVPYRAEFESYGDAGIEVVHVFEHGDGWSGDTGYITPAIVAQHADPAADLFVTAGPPAMIVAMEACMDALDVPVQHRMVERFSGYA